MIEKKLISSFDLRSCLRNYVYNTATKTNIHTRIEPRTRSSDYQKALSFEVYDPLWMLSRQWQFGRFKAVDCGTPVLVKIKTTRCNIDCVQSPKGKKSLDEYSTDIPMEYEVEKQNVEITPYVRVESAMYLKKLLLTMNVKRDVFAFLYENFKLENEIDKAKKNDLNSLKLEMNSALKDFYSFYANRSFDGYNVYDLFSKMKESDIDKYLKPYKIKKTDASNIKKALKTYIEWFKNKFLPCSGSTDYWSNEKLGYEVSIKQGANTYSAEDYDSGKLSWYSFDYSGINGKKKTLTKDDIKFLSYVPTPAKIPGAPASRLWEFEESSVFMGNCDNDYNTIGAAAIMQYVTMFSNDWMIMPLESETGSILDVTGIVVKDSFGDRYYITKNAEQLDEQNYNQTKKNNDPSYEKVIYTDRWNLFGSSCEYAYMKRNFSTAPGLLFPPTVYHCEESKPIEEVQFLRDEMANMVWGVETTINNRCGGSMDGRMLSDKVLSVVDEANLQDTEIQNEAPNVDNEVDDKKAAEYSLLIQNRVPINWIPFVPEQVKGDCRNIALRRGRMPVYYGDVFQSAAPSTDLLGGSFLDYKRDENNNVKPMYVNEEEVVGYGTKITKTAQRTRWFLGKCFNWIGNKQTISEYQANSGLMFDELISKATGKAITLKPEATEESPTVEELPETK